MERENHDSVLTPPHGEKSTSVEAVGVLAPYDL